jgi:uncharacterized protein
MWPIVLSCMQTQHLPRNKVGPETIILSPDLGLSSIEATLGPEGLFFPNGERLGWDAIEEINNARNSCFVIRDGRPEKILTYSTATNRVCSLMPTAGAPTMLVAGFTMYRITDCDPYRDTLAKIKAIAPLKGCVLDTATGLGYTAIEASRTALQVHTIELDPGTQEIARRNPWSRALFSNPNISRYMGDSYDLVDTFAAGMFDRIIHDPPAFSLAGQLYAGEFYRKLYRVLGKKGRLFHYIGDPASRSIANATRGVCERLRAAGFSRTRHCPEAFGVVADK